MALSSEQVLDPGLTDPEESAPGACDQRQCDNSEKPEERRRRLTRVDCRSGISGQPELAHARDLDLDVVAVEMPLIEVPVAQFQSLRVQGLVNAIARRHAVSFVVLADLNDARERALQLVAGPIAEPA